MNGRAWVVAMGVLAAMVGSGCVASALPAVNESTFVPEGEVDFVGTSVSYDETRVRGPRVNLSKVGEGSWRGRMGEQTIDVSVTPTTVRGVDFVLKLESADVASGTVVTGQRHGHIFRAEIHPDKVIVRAASHTITAGRYSPTGNLATDPRTAVPELMYGNKGEFILKGDFAHAIPAWPQSAFALMAAFDQG